MYRSSGRGLPLATAFTQRRTGLENRKLGGSEIRRGCDLPPSVFIILNCKITCLSWPACPIKHFDQRCRCTEHLFEEWPGCPWGSSRVMELHKVGPCRYRGRQQHCEKCFSGEALSFFKHSIMALQTHI